MGGSDSGVALTTSGVTRSVMLTYHKCSGGGGHVCHFGGLSGRPPRDSPTLIEVRQERCQELLRGNRRSARASTMPAFHCFVDHQCADVRGLRGLACVKPHRTRRAHVTVHDRKVRCACLNGVKQHTCLQEHLTRTPEVSASDAVANKSAFANMLLSQLLHS